jgi:hypothetical protein
MTQLISFFFQACKISLSDVTRGRMMARSDITIEIYLSNEALHTKRLHYQESCGQASENCSKVLNFLIENKVFDKFSDCNTTLLLAGVENLDEETKLFICTNLVLTKGRSATTASFITSLWGNTENSKLKKLCERVKQFLDTKPTGKQQNTLLQNEQALTAILILLALYKIKTSDELKSKAHRYYAYDRLCNFIHAIFNYEENGINPLFSGPNNSEFKSLMLDLTTEAVEARKIVSSSPLLPSMLQPRRVIIPTTIIPAASKFMTPDHKRALGPSHGNFISIQLKLLNAKLVIFKGHLSNKCQKTNSTGLLNIMGLQLSRNAYDSATTITTIIQQRLNSKWDPWLRFSIALFKSGRHSKVQELYNMFAGFRSPLDETDPREMEVALQQLNKLFNQANQFLGARYNRFTSADDEQRRQQMQKAGIKTSLMA